MSRQPWHTRGVGWLATVARKQRNYRLPEDFDHDLETVVEMNRFESKTAAVIYYLRKGVNEDLPAEIVAKRQAAIAKKVYDRELARLDEQELEEPKKKVG